MKIKNVDHVALLSSCTTRSQQVYVEKYILSSSASLPKNVHQTIDSLRQENEDIRDTNRSCVKQYILERFVMKCPYDKKQFYLIINNAIIFKLIQIKDLQQMVQVLDSDSSVSCDEMLKGHQAMSKIILELSKSRPTRDAEPNNPK